MPLNVAICGCAHGELELLYRTVEEAQKSREISVDLVLCCGDFESVRCADDLASMAVPPKYRRLKTFHRYYSGELKAPVLTIFVGGNHEASSYLWQLPYGGWVAPNIYYMGRASVLNVSGIRIAGLSGIYKKYNYLCGLYEIPPLDDQSMRSIYHTRAFDVFRLKLLKKPVDVLLTHDWPRGIDQFGDRQSLFRCKPYFQQECDSGELGSLPGFELLKMMAPSYWFAAHMHVKFAALVPHDNDRFTRFLALDKCLPGRQFLQILQIESTGDNVTAGIEYDAEWLAVLKRTDNLVSLQRESVSLPLNGSDDFSRCLTNDEDLQEVIKSFQNCLTVPTVDQFADTVYTKNGIQLNTQTDLFCTKLDVSNWPSISATHDDVPKPEISIVTSCEIDLDDE